MGNLNLHSKYDFSSLMGGAAGGNLANSNHQFHASNEPVSRMLSSIMMMQSPSFQMAGSNTNSSLLLLNNPNLSSIIQGQTGVQQAGSANAGANNSNNNNALGAPANNPNTIPRHPVDLGLQDPSVITTYLLLGGSMVNKNPELVNYLGITHVVNMAVELHPHIDLVGKRHVVYKHIRSDDSLQYNIRVHFEEAFDIIDDARSKNGRVLVHCMMGISRSGNTYTH